VTDQQKLTDERIDTAFADFLEGEAKLLGPKWHAVARQAFHAGARAIEAELSARQAQPVGCGEHQWRRTNYDGRRCSVCGIDGGWWCPKNPPTHACEYRDIEENCIHCGQPDERK
jgi:hypothetical protein